MPEGTNADISNYENEDLNNYKKSPEGMLYIRPERKIYRNFWIRRVYLWMIKNKVFIYYDQIFGRNSKKSLLPIRWYEVRL